MNPRRQRFLLWLRRWALWVPLGLALASPYSWALSYSSYQIDINRPGGDRPCTLFSLVGVNQSDTIVPNSVWFAIPPSAPGYKEMVATLLLAKAAGRNIDVATSGAVPAECGHPGVATIYLR